VLALNAIFACDCLVIPVSTDYLSLQAADHITRTLKVLEPVLKRRVERRYLLTRFDRRRRMSDDIRTKLRERYGDDVLDVVISENVAVAESPAIAEPGRLPAQHSSPGAHDYQATCCNVTN
jgi:chromosome partitioning protein